MAILYVLLFHALGVVAFVTKDIVGYNKFYIKNLFIVGNSGVELFFIISGYLIVRLYGNYLSKDKINSNYIKRRFLRIYPLWFLFSIFYSIILFISPSWYKVNYPIPHDQNLIHLIFLSLTFLLTFTTLNNSIVPGGWSIEVEIISYILYYLVRNISKRLMIILLHIYLLVVLFFHVGLFDYIGNNAVTYIFKALYNLQLPTVSIFFLFGGFLAQSINSHGKIVFKNMVDSKFIKKNIYLISLYLFLAFTSSPPYADSIYSVMGAIFLMSTIIFALQKFSFKKHIINIGKYSYFIYFFHFFILTTISYFLKEGKILDTLPKSYDLIYFITVLSTLLIVIPFAKLSYRFLEKPISKLK